MFKKMVLAILVVLSSFSSSANWVGGLGYINLSDKDDGLEINLSVITGSLSYKIDSNHNFYFMPEVRLATGISDDTITVFNVDVDIEMDRFIALSVRGQYELDNGVYLFAAPSYANIEFTVKASQDGQHASESDDSWELGFGGGVGYQFNESTSAEFIYEQYDGTDVLTLGVKVEF